MLASDLVKLGLMGCDIKESECNGDCEVVIDIHTGRLVALRPDDILGVYRKNATTEWLQEHLAPMHRQTLCSRVITSVNIRLKDIQQLVMRIDNKSEELKDHIHEGYGMGFSPQLIEFIVSHIADQQVARSVEDLVKSKFVVEAYSDIKHMDEKAAETLLPFIKTITLHCMMLTNDCSYDDLKTRFIQCVRILHESTFQDESNFLRSIGNEEALVKLMSIWQENGLSGKWDQIKEFPEMPVAQLSTNHQKQLLEADRLFTDLLFQHKNLLMKYEEETVRQDISKKIAARIGSSRNLLKTLKEEIARQDHLPYDLEVQTNPPETRTQESTGSVASLQQDRQAPANPGQHQPAHKQDKARMTDQHKTISEKPPEAAPAAASAAASSSVDGPASSSVDGPGQRQPAHKQDKARTTGQRKTTSRKPPGAAPAAASAAASSSVDGPASSSVDGPGQRQPHKQDKARTTGQRKTTSRKPPRAAPAAASASVSSSVVPVLAESAISEQLMQRSSSLRSATSCQIS